MSFKCSHMLGNAAEMLFNTASRVSDRPAVIDASAGSETSYDCLRSDTLAILAQLRRHCVAPGERVAILLPRGAASAAAYFGVLAAGAAAVPVSEALKPRQIDYILRHAGARCVLSAGRLRELLPKDIPALDVEELLNDKADHAPTGPVARTGGDLAHLIYTSGSTGMPKGVAVSHGNVWAGTSAVVDYLAINKADRIASLLPFSFDYGLNQLLCSVATGATLVVERSPVPQRIVESLFAFEVSVLPAVPPLWLQLLTSERFGAERLGRLRAMTNTGGHLPKEAVCRLRHAQPEADLILMYGLTEAFRSAYLSPRLVDAKPGSIGRAIPGAEVLVLREDGTPCAAGEVGELVHRGPTVTLGYWNDPAATAERFRPNPLHPAGMPDVERVVFSGDLVYRDAAGDHFFVGRRDSLIKSLGHRVSADEVCEALYASGEIVEAIISTEPDAIRGSAIIAHVVLDKDGDLDRLKRFAARELPRHMQPVRFEKQASLARTASGKHDPRAMAVPAE